MGLVRLVAFAAVVACSAAEVACSDARACAASAAVSAEQDSAVGLLQQNAKGRDIKAGQHQTPNATAVWDQLAGAVQVDQLRAAIDNAANSPQVGQLQAELQSLEAQYPDAATIQQQFSSTWSQITHAVQIQDLQQQLSSALNSQEKNQLEQKLQELTASMPSVDLNNVQQQAANTWASLLNQGVPLPDLAEVSDLANQAAQQASAVASQAAEAAASAANNVANAIGGYFNSWR